MKRLDLQGIRGIAIILVILFHFFPLYFPNGYLGVDQFFVLSGFLMCMLLNRAGKLAYHQLIGLFYFKRFKRILPLYFLIIFLSLISLYAIFPDTAVENNLKSAKNAILFMSNRLKTDQENYFEKLSIAMDIFTHTWSLSVEVQFYIIVPFIFILGSWAPYTFQIVIGMIVFMLSENPIISDKKNQDIDCEKLIFSDKEDIRKASTTLTVKYTTLLSIIYITIYPLSLPSVITRYHQTHISIFLSLIRPFITIATGLLIMVSKDDYFLSNKYLTYIGDISYSLYLIHWPIYSFWKLTMDGNQILLITCILLSVTSAVITYEIFEKWYLKLSTISVSILVIILISLNLIVMHKDVIREKFEVKIHNYTRLDGILGNITFEEAAKLNNQWNLNDLKNLKVPSCIYENGERPFGWCNHTGLDPTSKYKIFLFGNSWAGNHGNMIYQECRKAAKTILQASAYGCEPIYSRPDDEPCVDDIEEYNKRLEQFQPDYAILIARFFDTSAPINTTLHMDPVYQSMITNIKSYINNIRKKLFILEPIPHFEGGYVKSITDDLSRNVKLSDMDNKFVDMTGYDEIRERYAQLFKDCGDKCQLISYQPDFYDKITNTFRYFDDKNGLSFVTSANHLSPHGVEKIRHIYRDICDNL